METVKDCIDRGLKEISIQGEKYYQDTDQYGNEILKMFDEKDNIWIELIFSNYDMGVEHRITSMLSDEYIEQQIRAI